MNLSRCFRSLLLMGFVGLSFGALAQDKPLTVRPYGIGDGVNNFALKNVDETTIGLANYADRAGLIVVFISNHCPISRAYEDRLLALDRAFSPKGYPVLTVMSDDPATYEADSFVNMKARARQKNFTFPYLSDDAQTVARAFGATRTPQAFVLHRVGSQFRVAYSGAIDDSPQDVTAVKEKYIELTVNELLNGQPVTKPVTKPVGCALTLRE